jgi:hypothetical protein
MNTFTEGVRFELHTLWTRNFARFRYPTPATERMTHATRDLGPSRVDLSSAEDTAGNRVTLFRFLVAFSHRATAAQSGKTSGTDISPTPLGIGLKSENQIFQRCDLPARWDMHSKHIGPSCRGCPTDSLHGRRWIATHKQKCAKKSKSSRPSCSVQAEAWIRHQANTMTTEANNPQTEEFTIASFS